MQLGKNGCSGVSNSLNIEGIQTIHLNISNDEGSNFPPILLSSLVSNTHMIILPQRTAILNTFAASYLNIQGLNNSCLKSPASTLVDLNFQSRALRSFSLNQLRNLSL